MKSNIHDVTDLARDVQCNVACCQTLGAARLIN